MIRIVTTRTLRAWEKDRANAMRDYGQAVYAQNMAEVEKNRWKNAVVQANRLIADMATHLNNVNAYLTNDVQYGMSENGAQEAQALHARAERFLDINRVL